MSGLGKKEEDGIVRYHRHDSLHSILGSVSDCNST